MRARESWGRYLTWAVVIAGVILLATWLRLLVTTLLISAVVAYVLEPFVEAICRVNFPVYRPPKSLGATLVVLLALLLTGILVWLVIFPTVVEQSKYLANQWPEIKASLEKLQRNVTAVYQENVPPYLRERMQEVSDRFLGRVSHYLEASLGAVGRSFTLVAELVLVPILVFYFLTEIKLIKEEVLFFLPEKWRPKAERTLRIIDFVFRRYVRGQVILCLVAFAVVTLGLWALGGIKFYLLLGLFAGLTRAIPIIGPVVGAAPLLIAVLVAKPFHYSLWVLAAFILMHFLESKLLMPKVLGLQLRIHPVLIIAVLLIGAEFFGVVGMFLAVPVFAAFKFLLADYRRPQGAPPDQLALDLSAPGAGG
jgi:predicted PurR-regulated permease PerM